MRISKTVLWVSTSVVLGALLTGVWVVLGPSLDNTLGYGTRRDLSVVRSYPVGGRRLDQVAAMRYEATAWRAFHTEATFRTIVECEGTSRSGRRVLLRWEVLHGMSPYHAIKPRRVFLCALSRDAAELAPALAPPGMLPGDYGDSIFSRSEALYGWASKNWVDGDPGHPRAPQVNPCPSPSQQR